MELLNANKLKETVKDVDRSFENYNWTYRANCWEQIGEENNFGETESNEDVYPYWGLVNRQGL